VGKGSGYSQQSAGGTGGLVIHRGGVTLSNQMTDTFGIRRRLYLRIDVNLPVVSLGSLNAVGKTAGDTRFPIGLSCAASANVYITLGDATTPGNTSSLLTLAPNSTAGGIKLRILNGTGPMDFGPDSAQAGTSNQWLLGTSNSIGVVPLTVQYYRDDTDPSGSSPAPLAAGSVHAQATFTPSYQ
jgi:type 1 fimbria pilin